MDPENFEQTEIPKALVGVQARFLEAGMKLAVEFVGGRPIQVLFPDVLEVKIASTAPPAHQVQATNFKPATLENGVEVMVPQLDRKSTRLNSSHLGISYAVFCLKKMK